MKSIIRPLIFSIVAQVQLLGLAHGFTLQLDGSPTVVFEQGAKGCFSNDGPDTPAVGFRNAAGEIALLASSYRNVMLFGPHLGQMAKACSVSFEAGHNPNPDALDDRAWLHAFHTDDGQNVFAIASSGYMPHRHSRSCGTDTRRTACWYNGIVGVVSSDGGRSFRYTAPPPGHVLLSPPQPYAEADARPAGFITATNFVELEQHLYTLVRYRPDDKASFICVFRFAKDDKSRIEFWSKDRFVAYDPQAYAKPGSATCQGVGLGAPMGARGLAYHEASKTFVTVFEWRYAKTNSSGIFHRTSKDLVSWTPPAQIVDAPLNSNKNSERPYVAYPSILDEKSPSRILSRISDRPSLTYVEIVPRLDSKGKSSPVRRLVSVPIVVR